jgi:long-chain acyl-CoA synthetase
MKTPAKKPAKLTEKTLPKILKAVAKKYPRVGAQYFRNAKGGFDVVTYNSLLLIMLDFGAGLLASGIRRGDHIGLISDNRKEWFQADMGLMAIGAADVPRGCDVSERDLRFILSSAECKTVIAENTAQATRILGMKAVLPLLARLIVFDPAKKDTEIAALAERCAVELCSFDDIRAHGRRFRAGNRGAVEAELDKGGWDDLACIIFTSGTTGEPKGAMLSHGNFITQLDELNERIYLHPGERAILVLPVWHAFERLCEYVAASQAAGLCYSKPVGSALLSDMQKLNPQLLPAVPRVFEALYDGIRRTVRKKGGVSAGLFAFFVAIAKLHSALDRRLFRKTARFSNDYIVLQWLALGVPWLLLYPLKLLGGVFVFRKIRTRLGIGFRAGISGGGALPPNIDAFFWAIGIRVVEGYGLTETAPVVCVRPVDAPVFGTVGKPIRGVEAQVVDSEGKPLPAGQQGSLRIRGGTVMKGYYKRADLNAAVLSSDGWFDTGDLAVFTVSGELALRGRKKDTIVLRGGENVEPLPLELKLAESRYVAQAVVVGQNERYLGALILPEKDEVAAYAAEQGLAAASYGELLKTPEIGKLFYREIRDAVSAKNGFRSFERIGRFVLLEEAFAAGKTLSAKQEIMRYKLPEIYAREFKQLFGA